MTEPALTGPALTDRPLTDRLVTLGLVDWPDPLWTAHDDVMAIGSSAPHHGFAALLGAAVDQGLVQVDESSRAEVQRTWAERMAWCVRLDAALVAVHRCLERAGVPVRVLKGSALAVLDEPDPSWRTYGDVDVLVPPDRLLDALDALADSGWQPVVAPVRRWWAGSHAKGITLVDGSGVQVDLHRQLAVGPLGRRLNTEQFFTNGEQFPVGASVLTALSRRDRFIHACYHGVLGGTFGPRQVRDVLLLAHQLAPASLTAAEQIGWSPTVVATAVRAAAVSGAVPSAWLEWIAAVVPDPADAALIDAANAPFGEGVRADARSLHGRWQRVAYLAALAWPSRAHLASRGLTRVGHLASLARHRNRSDGSGSGRA